MCGSCSLHLDLRSALCLQLKVKITRQLAAREQKLRRKNLTKYIPNAAAAVFKVLQTMSEVRCTKLCKLKSTAAPARDEMCCSCGSAGLLKSFWRH